MRTEELRRMLRVTGDFDAVAKALPPEIPRDAGVVVAAVLVLAVRVDELTEGIAALRAVHDDKL
jgi:hypothetical protein